MTTFQQWVDGFRDANLSITGVTRHYDEPPASINTADLPAAWPSIFSGGYSGQTWSCDELNENYTMSFVVACLLSLAALHRSLKKLQSFGISTPVACAIVPNAPFGHFPSENITEKGVDVTDITI